MQLKNNRLLTWLLLISFNSFAADIDVVAPIDNETPMEFDFGDAFGDKPSKKNMGFPLRGKLSFDLGYQIGQPNRWQTLGPYAQLIVDKQSDYGQLYSEVTVRNNYAFNIEKDSQATQDEYQLYTIVRELYWKKAFNDLTLTLGRSIVTWGKADLSLIIDIVSPADNSGSLFAYPEEIKVGQNVIKLDWYHNNNEVNFVFIPRAENNIQIEKGHPYDTLGAFNRTNNIADNDNEWAVRWNQTHDKWEFSAVMGDVHQRDPIYFGSEQTWLKNQVLGFGINVSADPFLWKAETLLIKDRPMQKLDFTGSKAKDSYKAMLGFDYSHKTYGNWIVEYSIDTPINTDNSVLLGEGSKIFALAWSDSFLKDDLTANAVFLNLGDNIGNHLFRTGLSYKLDDDWSIVSLLSIINASGSEPYLKLLSNFDRFDISLNYNFDLAN